MVARAVQEGRLAESGQVESVGSDEDGETIICGVDDGFGVGDGQQLAVVGVETPARGEETNVIEENFGVGDGADHALHGDGVRLDDVKLLSCERHVLRARTAELFDDAGKLEVEGRAVIDENAGAAPAPLIHCR